MTLRPEPARAPLILLGCAREHLRLRLSATLNQRRGAHTRTVPGFDLTVGTGLRFARRVELEQGPDTTVSACTQSAPDDPSSNREASQVLVTRDLDSTLTGYARGLRAQADATCDAATGYSSSASGGAAPRSVLCRPDGEV